MQDPSLADQVEQIFRKHDSTGCGVMKVADLKQVLGCAGLSESMIEVVLRDVDGDINDHVVIAEVLANLFGTRASTVKRIVVTGGPCGGKSSALSSLGDAMKALGIDVYLIPEVPTVLLGGGCVFPGSGGGQKLVDFETALIQLQLQHEKSFTDIARSTGRPSVIFCDRGVMDIAAYLPKESWEEILAAQRMTESSILARYDAVMHLVTAADGAEAFYKSGSTKDDSGKDVYRQETPEQARKLDEQVLTCWSKHPKVCRVANLNDGFEGKLKRATDFAVEVVGGGRIDS
eukprot:TRINITY_DN23997_c0_g1_i1.p1 TRINITY_DN23997_c0_g1~~TRINITY_DN23997_c0_g1_i1.p1  ORF type:complete len:289 (-),score=59.20 TRINITY_DN23997_c0_g1_i1:245-1111(-)